jgi:hypothetical protein
MFCWLDALLEHGLTSSLIGSIRLLMASVRRSSSFIISDILNRMFSGATLSKYIPLSFPHDYNVHSVADTSAATLAQLKVRFLSYAWNSDID